MAAYSYNGTRDLLHGPFGARDAVSKDVAARKLNEPRLLLGCSPPTESHVADSATLVSGDSNTGPRPNDPHLVNPKP